MRAELESRGTGEEDVAAADRMRWSSVSNKTANGSAGNARGGVPHFKQLLSGSWATRAPSHDELSEPGVGIVNAIRLAASRARESLARS